MDCVKFGALTIRDRIYSPSFFSCFPQCSKPEKTALDFCCFLVDRICGNLGWNYSCVKWMSLLRCQLCYWKIRINRSLVFSGLGSEECNPLNMSIEAELVIEQMKEHHRRDLCHLRLELEDKVSPPYQSCSLISLSSNKLLHVVHSQLFVLIV